MRNWICFFTLILVLSSCTSDNINEFVKHGLYHEASLDVYIEPCNASLNDYGIKYFIQAIKSGKQELCDKTTEPLLCKDLIDRNKCTYPLCQAMAKMDSGYCRILRFPYNEKCNHFVYFYKAVDMGNIKYCKIITDTEIRYLCMQQFSGSYNKEYGEEICKDLAYLKLGKDNAFYCKNINDIWLKAECFDKLYFRIAVAETDHNFCNKIKYIEDYDYCIERVDKAIYNNATHITDCAKIRSNVTRQKCTDLIRLRQISSASRADSCKDIKTLKDWCFFDLARNTGNSSYCTYINNESLNQLCKGIVVNKKYCDNLSISFKEICLGGIKHY